MLAARLGLERALGAALLLLAAGIGLRSTPPQLWLWAGTVLLGVAIAILNVLLPSIIKRDFPTRIGPITGAYWPGTRQAVGACLLASGPAWRSSPSAFSPRSCVPVRVIRRRAPPHPDGLAPHGPVLTDSRVNGVAPWRHSEQPLTCTLETCRPMAQRGTTIS